MEQPIGKTVAEGDSWHVRLLDRVRGAHGVDFEQAILRIVLCFVVIVYMLVLKKDSGIPADVWRIAFLITGVVFVSGLIIFVLVVLRPMPSMTRRVIAALIDTWATSVCLYYLDELSTPWWWLYLWITVGNGFRYGPTLLYVSAGSSLIGFILITNTSLYWQDNREFAIGLILCLVIIPGYVGVLLRRLQHQTDRAQAASRSKTLFLANVNHELRTPLQAIILQTQLVQSGLEPHTLQQRLQVIFRSATQMLDLVSQLLDLARSDAAQEMPIIYEKMDIRSFLDDFISTISPILRGSNRLTVRYEGDPPNILCSASRLRQIVVNLVRNSDKFTANGQIEVAVTRDPIRQTMLLTVSDTGRGISPEALSHIFDAFFQDTSDSAENPGIGIGLWVTRRIVFALGGRIDVHSVLGKGTRFDIRIPLSPPNGCVSVEAAASDPRVVVEDRPLHILLAEDEDIIRGPMVVFLESADITVDECKDGNAAARSINDPLQHYDVVVLDHRMPGLTGSQILRMIRVDLMLDVPVILLTGDENDDLVRLCQRLDAVMIYKPITPGRLISAVREAAAQCSSPSSLDTLYDYGPPDLRGSAVSFPGTPLE